MVKRRYPRASSGTPNRYKAVLTNYTCHPLCVGNSSNLASADYQGVLRRRVEETFGNIEVLRRRGKTVLFNSHILADVAELCSRIAIMDRGQVVWQGAVQEALADGSGDLEAFFVRTVGK